MLVAEPTYRVGLRFDRNQIPALEEIVAIQRAEGRRDIGAFDRALTATRAGEPLIVLCSHPDEAQRIAASFVRVGVDPPAIETLTS